MGLLSSADKEIIKRALPKSSNKIIDVTVARLYIAYPDPNEWQYTGLSGAIALVDDLVGNTFFLKLVDINGHRGVLWDQELYVNFEYNQDRTFFHTFEMESCYAGLLFVDLSEAAHFHKRVEKRQKYASKKTLNNKNAVAMAVKVTKENASKVTHGPRGEALIDNQRQRYTMDKVEQLPNTRKKAPPPPPPSAEPAPESTPDLTQSETTTTFNSPSPAPQTETPQPAENTETQTNPQQHQKHKVPPLPDFMQGQPSGAPPPAPPSFPQAPGQPQPQSNNPFPIPVPQPPQSTSAQAGNFPFPVPQEPARNFSSPSQFNQPYQPGQPAFGQQNRAVPPPPPNAQRPVPQLPPGNRPVPSTGSRPPPPPSRRGPAPPPPPHRNFSAPSGQQSMQTGAVQHSTRRGPVPPPPPRGARPIPPPPQSNNFGSVPATQSQQPTPVYQQPQQPQFNAQQVSQQQAYQPPPPPPPLPTNQQAYQQQQPPPPPPVSSQPAFQQGQQAQAPPPPPPLPVQNTSSVSPSNGAPAAPPPPPAFLSGTPGQSQPPAPGGQINEATGDPGRDALLASIRGAGGIGALRKVDKSQLDKPSVLLQEARGEPVQTSQPTGGAGAPPGGPGGSLADALAAALNQRKNKVGAGDDYDNGDDW
ncbi:related to Proline-rich protein LAS17 [Nakaseomyces glabratus]|nr:WH2 domain profile [Nakaseomyces glabratus]SCV14403.1 related to Proline-rich protein LAS17 [Nakaseomyces glabratus]SLM13077.1 related to Proline-rich protein LAS17 [Nakaseomyces glabratus]